MMVSPGQILLLQSLQSFDAMVFLLTGLCMVKTDAEYFRGAIAASGLLFNSYMLHLAVAPGCYKFFLLSMMIAFLGLFKNGREVTWDKYFAAEQGKAPTDKETHQDTIGSSNANLK